MFKELSDFALSFLTLPVSNAVVERVFSVMNTTKTKLRNRMSMDMLVSLIRIKLHCKVKKICCTNFVPTNAIYLMIICTIMIVKLKQLHLPKT